MQEDTYTGNPSDPLSLNLYTYCHNEPLMYWDPTGHDYEYIITSSGVQILDTLNKNRVVYQTPRPLPKIKITLNPKAALKQLVGTIADYTKPGQFIKSKVNQAYDYINEKAPVATGIAEALIDEAQGLINVTNPNYWYDYAVENTINFMKNPSIENASVAASIIMHPVETTKNVAGKVKNYVESKIVNGNSHTRAEAGTHGVVFIASFFGPKSSKMTEAVVETTNTGTNSISREILRNNNIKSSMDQWGMPENIDFQYNLNYSNELNKRVAVPGDADFIGPIPGDSWRLTPRGQGAHILEKVNVKERTDLAQFDTKGTPRYYPNGTPENAGQAHIRLHKATKEAGIDLQGGNPNMTDTELIEAYTNAYSNPNLEGILGDLRTPNSKVILGNNISPLQALLELLKWGKKDK